ncbi:MAG: ATP synthase F0 subunit B [Microgenomates group bacterium]|nr:ATP synthase F0 subunit B [Microgenomates group bacterium]
MENLGIDGKLLLAQIINFVLFYLIIKKFVARPFLKTIEEEKQKDQEKEKLLAQIKKQEEEYLKKEEQLKEKAKREMDLIIKQAVKEAQTLKKEIIEEAKKDAETIRRESRKEMEKEKEQLYREVKQKVLDLALILVGQALKDALSEEEKKKISQKILNSLDKTVSLYEN